MENVSNISSEEELLQLRNEGKLSEEEYGELLETLRKTGRADVGRALQEKPASMRTCGLTVVRMPARAAYFLTRCQTISRVSALPLRLRKTHGWRPERSSRGRWACM